MKYTIQILQKAVAKEYYRHNIGFLFLVLLFSGSFLRANEHIALGKLAVNLPNVLAGYGLIWTTYAIKTYLFSLRLLENPSATFLYNVALLPVFKRYWTIILMQVNLLALNLVYSIFIIYLGIQEHQWWAIYSIILLDLMLISIGVYLFDLKLKRQNFVQNEVKLFSYFSFNFKTPYTLFFVRYLLNKQPILLFSSKLGACLLLIGICKLYPTDEYDVRLFSIGGLFVAAINMFIVMEHFIFENQFFKLIKNLPMSFSKRITEYSKTFFCLFIPEFLALFRYLPKAIDNLIYAQLCIFIFSLNLLIISILHINIPQEKLLTRLFYGGVFVFLLIMFKVPILLISIANTVIGFVVFRKTYYSSDPQNL